MAAQLQIKDISPDLLRDLKLMATMEGKTLKQYVIDSLNDAIDNTKMDIAQPGPYKKRGKK